MPQATILLAAPASDSERAIAEQIKTTMLPTSNGG
jgi:hypothetical protein